MFIKNGIITSFINTDNKKEVVQQFNAYSVIGEEICISSEYRSKLSYLAVEESEVYYFTVNNLEEVYGLNYLEELNRDFMFASAKKISKEIINESNLTKNINNFKLVFVEKSGIIVSEKLKEKKIIFVLKGEIFSVILYFNYRI